MLTQSWSDAVAPEFDKLSRLVQRQNTLSGSTVEPVPPVYLRVLVTLRSLLAMKP